MTQTVAIHVAFTELAGARALVSRLGPAVGDVVRGGHLRLLRAASERFGGNGFATVGDGMLIVFPSLGAALDGSIAMQLAIDEQNRLDGVPLGVRIGLSAGDAIRVGEEYSGEPVVEAARLCARSAPGQILITAAIASSDTTHVFVPAGEVELRGVSLPVAVVSVRWRHA